MIGNTTGVRLVQDGVHEGFLVYVGQHQIRLRPGMRLFSNVAFGSIRAGSLLTSTMAAIRGSGHSDQDFRFSRINVRFGGDSGLLKRAI